MKYRVELRRTLYELHEVEAGDEKAAIAALNEQQDTLLSEEEEDSEVMAVTLVEAGSASVIAEKDKS